MKTKAGSPVSRDVNPDILHGSGMRLPEFRTLQVSLMCDVSLRQLQWWDQQGIVCPTVVLHSRYYTVNQTVEVALCAACRRKAVPLRMVRRVLEVFRKRTRGLLPGIYVLVGLRSAQVIESPDQALQALRRSDGPLTAICLDDEITSIRAAVQSRVKAGRTKAGAQGGQS